MDASFPPVLYLSARLVVSDAVEVPNPINIVNISVSLTGVKMFTISKIPIIITGKITNLRNDM